MKRAALLSALLHLVVLGLLIFGLPWLPHRNLDMAQPISFAMAPVGEVTTMTATKPKPQEEKNPKKEKSKPTKPEEEPKPAPKEPPKPEQIKPEPKPEVAPEPKSMPKEEPKPKPKPEKKAPKVEKKPEKLEKKVEKKVEKKKEKLKKDTQEDFLSVLKNLKKSSTSNDASETSKSDALQSMNRGVLSDTLTMSELDALRRQIAGCWSIPAGIQQAEDLAVEIAVSVNPDMTVREAKIIDARRMAGDPHFRVAAESALRAVLHPRCSPLKLPPKKYLQWKEFTFVFNPKDML